MKKRQIKFLVALFLVACILSSLIYWIHNRTDLYRRIEMSLSVNLSDVQRVMIRNLRTQKQTECDKDSKAYTEGFLAILNNFTVEFQPDVAASAEYEYELVFEESDRQWIFLFLGGPHDKGLVDYNCTPGNVPSGILTLNKQGEVKVRRLIESCFTEEVQ